MIKLSPPPQRGESSKEERYHYWQQVMDCYESSDMTRLAFCKQQALKIDDFRRWCYRLSCAAGKTLTSAAHNTKSSKAVPQASHFVSVQIMPSATHSQYTGHSIDDPATANVMAAPFVIELRQDIQVHVYPPFVSSSLKQLLKTLGEVAC